MLIKNNRGFTLIEIMIVLAITGIVLSLVSIIIIQSVSIYNSIIRKTSYMNSADNIISVLVSHLADAKYITISENNDEAEYPIIYSDEDYDGIWLCFEAGNPVHIFTARQINAKAKVTFLCAEPDINGKYSSLIINTELYERNADNDDIENSNITPLYTHNTTLYIPDILFGIRLSGGIDKSGLSFDDYIKSRKPSGYDNSDLKAENELLNELCERNRLSFKGRCISFK